MQNLLKMTVCLTVLLIVAAGCKKKEVGEANQPQGTGTSDSNQQAQQSSSAAGQQDLEQVKANADTMSESQLRQSAQRVGSDFKDVQSQLTSKMDQLRKGGVGGMIAGQNPQQIQQDVQKLRQKAQNLRAEYNVYASKLQEKGIQIPALSQSQQQGSADANQATQQGQAADANQSGTTGQSTLDSNQTNTQQQSQSGMAGSDANKTQDSNQM